MEDRDPTQEWKIQEYSSPSGGSSKVSWILNKGLCLGKKFVVTGIVISSAPLVLPPLVVLSALGLAFSVPFGFYFASYACTEKLMSKLLSRPTPPLMLDYGTDDEETSGYEAEEDVGFGGGIDMEEEEEEQMEDIKEGVEMRVELLEKGNEGREQGNVPMEDNYGRGGLEMDQKPAKDVDEVLKEEGYEKDDEELGEEIRKEQPLKKIIVEVSRGEQPLEEMGGVEVVVKGNEENGSKVEVEKPVGLKRGVVGERGGVEKASKIKKKEVKKPLKEQYYSVYKTPEENKQSSRSMAKGGVDFEGLPVSAGVVPESRSAVISTEKDITMPSDKNFAKGGKYGGELDLLEEEEIMKGTKNGVEIRIELLEKINEKLEAGNLLLAVDHGQGGFKKDEQKPVEYEKGRGYEEDNGVSSVKEEEHPWLETDVTIEGVREEENVSNIEEEKKIVMVESRDQHLAEEWAGNVVVVGAHEKNANNVEVEEPSGATSGVVQNRGREERVIYIEEGGKPGRETRGVMEESRYEGNVDNAVEEDEQRFKENARNVKEMEKLSEDEYVYNVNMERLVGEIKPTVNESRDRIVPKDNEKMRGEKMRRSSFEDNVYTVSKEVKPVREMGGVLEGNSYETNNNNSLEAKNLMGDTNGMIDLGSMTEAEDYVARGDCQPDREKKNIIFSYADAREIADESGFDLFDEENASALQYSDELYEYPEGEVLETEALYYYPPFSDVLGLKVDIGPAQGSVQNKHYSDNIGDKNSDFVKLPVSNNLSESEDAQIASEKEIIVASNKALFSEDKIWEQIDALRTIVGYKAVSHGTCIEEIKALYIFTGVEPPVSFKDPSDLVDISDKLRFLMSIVGVK